MGQSRTEEGDAAAPPAGPSVDRRTFLTTGAAAFAAFSSGYAWIVTPAAGAEAPDAEAFRALSNSSPARISSIRFRPNAPSRSSPRSMTISRKRPRRWPRPSAIPAPRRSTIFWPTRRRATRVFAPRSSDHRLRLVPRLHRHADFAPRRGRHRVRHLHQGADVRADDGRHRPSDLRPRRAQLLGRAADFRHRRRRCRRASSRGAASRRKASARSR